MPRHRELIRVRAAFVPHRPLRRQLRGGSIGALGASRPQPLTANRRRGIEGLAALGHPELRSRPRLAGDQLERHRLARIDPMGEHRVELVTAADVVVGHLDEHPRRALDHRPVGQVDHPPPRVRLSHRLADRHHHTLQHAGRRPRDRRRCRSRRRRAATVTVAIVADVAGLRGVRHRRLPTGVPAAGGEHHHNRPSNTQPAPDPFSHHPSLPTISWPARASRLGRRPTIGPRPVHHDQLGSTAATKLASPAPPAKPRRPIRLVASYPRPPAANTACGWSIDRTTARGSGRRVQMETSVRAFIERSCQLGAGDEADHVTGLRRDFVDDHCSP